MSRKTEAQQLDLIVTKCGRTRIGLRPISMRCAKLLLQQSQSPKPGPVRFPDDFQTRVYSEAGALGIIQLATDLNFNVRVSLRRKNGRAA